MAALNQGRPVFSQRALKVVLIADEATYINAARNAPDFVDWISNSVEAPARQPDFIRRSLDLFSASFRGISWLGGPPDAALKVLGRAFSHAPSPSDYGALLESFRGNDDWQIVPIRDGRDAKRLQWALAESKREGKVIVTGSLVSGWPILNSEIASYDDAELLVTEHPGAWLAAVDAEYSALKTWQSDKDIGLALEADDGAAAVSSEGVRAYYGAPTVRAMLTSLLEPLSFATLPALDPEQALEEHSPDLALQWAGEGTVTWGQALLDLGRYEKAETALLGLDVNDARVALTLAETLYRRRKYTQAELLLRNTLAELKASTKNHDDHIDLAAYLLSEVLNAQGLNDASETSLRESLASAESELSYGQALAGLSRWLANEGRFSEAEHLQREFLNDRTPGEGQPVYLEVLTQLAKVLGAQQRHKEAESALRQVLQLEEQTFGKAHPTYAKVLTELAAELASQGRFSDAEPLLIESIGMMQQFAGLAAIERVFPLAQLASIYSRQARYNESETLLRRVVEIQAVHNPQSGSLAGTLFRLGQMTARRDPEEGAQLAIQALAILEPTVGVDHPDTRQVRQFLASLQGAE